MDNRHISLLVPPGNEGQLKEATAEGKTVIKYDDNIIPEKRRPLAGRPAGSECGNSCTCS